MCGTITEIKPHPKRSQWVVVWIDGEAACAVPVEEASHLQRGQVLSAEELARLQVTQAYYEAKELALGYLARRPRSIAEVARYLRQKGFTDAVIERVLERLHALAYLDDRAFAQYWVEQRATFRPCGVLALRYELRQKGVPDEIIEDILSQVDEEAMAWKALRPQLRRWRNLDWSAFQQKATSYLARRGFPYDIIHDVVQRAWHERTTAASGEAPIGGEP